jgi:hypothetical protein
MPRKENPATRSDPTPGKSTVTVGDRGQSRPAARDVNRHKVDESATRDEPVQSER